MKGGGSAPAPDPQIGQAALWQAQTGANWLAFAKSAFKVTTKRQGELDALTKRVTEQQIGISGEQLKQAKADRDRYNKTYKPIEDRFIKDATNYDSPARQAAAAAEAKADVRTAAAASSAAAERNAASMGINPASGRWAGVERAGDLGTALATADAANKARTAVRDKGLALRADVVNLGRGLPAQSAQAAALGLSAGSNAVGLNQGNQQTYLGGLNIMNQGFAGAGAGYQGMANTLNQQYSTQVQAWDAEQRSRAADAAGIGSALGGLFGLIKSDKNAKTEKEPIDDGAALDAVKKMPVETWRYKPGLGDDTRHVGTYAQDFKEQTGHGDGTTIPAQDAIGVTMAAVKDLASEVEALRKQVGIGKRAANDDQPGLRRNVA